MRKMLVMSALTVSACFSVTAALAKDQPAPGSGEALFRQHCAMCHPEGGNAMNPKKTLHKKDLGANKIKTPEDIVKKMRNPGQGMMKFDEKTIADKNAKEIAEYILKTFK